jgi:hypothetical protein
LVGGPYKVAVSLVGGGVDIVQIKIGNGRAILCCTHFYSALILNCDFIQESNSINWNIKRYG